MEELVLHHALAHVDAICYNFLHRCLNENDIDLIYQMGGFPRPERPPVLIVRERSAEASRGEHWRRNADVLLRAAK
jgi:hypothetical protein